MVEASIQLEDTTLRAPYDGVIAQRFVEQGQNVRAKERVVKFQDVDEIEVLVDVPETVMAADLRAADIVSAPINTLLEASNDADVLANGYVTEVEYKKYGKKLKVHGSPWNFSETPAQIGIAPELGQHNDAVLREIGYSAQEIQGFRDRKVI